MTTSAKFYGVLCTSIFIGILVACFWPFHSPGNQVDWLKPSQGVRLGGYGTIISPSAVMPPARSAPDAWTLELWLRPGMAYQSATILAFYNPAQPRGLSLRQWNTDVVLESRLWSNERSDESREFWVPGIFRRRPAAFLSLASGPQGTKAYIDGKLVRVASPLRLSSDELSGRLVVANSPVDNDSWFGDLRGLALYTGEQNQAQVLRHYTTWTMTGRPAVTQEEDLVALYLFNESSGNVVHNQVRSGTNLSIPEQYLEIHQSFLKRPWNEYQPGWSYWKNVLINVAGFVPLGFFFYGYLFLALHVRRAALLTVLIGGFLSFTVETLQAFLPTRDSGMTDIITNTLGTGAGLALWRWMSIICESLSDSPHTTIRRLVGLFVRHGQEERLTASERA